MEIVVQYFAGCRSWPLALQRARAALARVGRGDVRLSPVLIEGEADAVRFGFRGSPTILVDGRDPFAAPSIPVTFACRIYPTPEGFQSAPTVDQLAEAIIQGGTS